MKIAIATNDKKSVNKEFGRSQFFAVYDNSEKTFDFIDNSETDQASHGAGIIAVNNLNKHSINTVLAFQIGPKALDALRSSGIDIFKVDANITLEEAVKLFSEGKLTKY